MLEASATRLIALAGIQTFILVVDKLRLTDTAWQT
jgi:hypothetical protein